ncbi:MAG: transglutaminase domain-containing protein [Polyangiaceae bacterium]|nr:transglutaminase domain-containing protein [Polyangiaceae bacterium]
MTVLRVQVVDFPTGLAKAQYMKRASAEDVVLDAVQRWASVFRQLPYDDRAPAILKFCQYALEYVRDPKREVLEDSSVTLKRGFGDCDAKSRVFIALCLACDVPARSYPVRPEADFPHVLAEVFWRGAWHRADPTILNSEIGRIPPGTMAVTNYR